MIRLPPIGFVLPVAAALGVAITLLPEGYATAPRPTEGLPDPTAPAMAAPLPPLSDAVAVTSAFAERPLLAENRQPPQTDAPQNAPPDRDPGPQSTNQPAVPQIAGMMALDGQTRVLLRDTATGTERWTLPGDTFAGWTLVEITQMAAVLESSGVQVTIQLFQDRLP